MTYKFENMTQDQAEDIAYNWHYAGEYSFYDMEADKEDLEEFVDPETRGDHVYAVSNNLELIGFFSVNKVDEEIFDIGLGMRPDLTGSGKGLEFLKEGIEFVKNEYKPEKITLSVATFNQRAIKVYRKLGFKDVHTFMQDTNGSIFEFLKMEYEY
ncbi:N-acetyltransferase [Oceanobacillus piezotolerans]|uniref:N-acetyltransferase n=1 Tax=Oceanobacillus piezotolerans TaxID=2448030 RepID=A0A498D996_9BACI|nr:GNAT family protein [Oceanobacillus piezotolerans]RLL40628.1 N-acetyltransferase [Oceanobacillus piezotolerans]